MQAQYSPSPYIGLWARLERFRLEDLTGAILDKSVVKATLMRGTLHLISARDYPYFTTTTGDTLVSMWRKEVEKAGLQVPALHKTLLGFTTVPRPFAELVAFTNELVGEVPRPHDHRAFQWAQAPGWLLHVPPSGTWRYFGSNSYMSAHEWLGTMDPPSTDEAFVHIARRYLAAFGPASIADFARWAGIRTVARAQAAIEALNEDLVTFRNDAGKPLYDLKDAPRPGSDVIAPVRFLPKWDNLILGYDVRERVLPERYRKAVIKINGDVVPTILVDGVVAGMWGTSVERNTALMKIELWDAVNAATVAALEEEGDKLVRFVEPEAAKYEVRISGSNA